MGYTKTILLLFVFCLSVGGYAQNKTDVPREGEGVHKFLQRNNRKSAADYEVFIELNKSKLGRNNTLIKGVKYTLPPVSNKTDGGKSPTNSNVAATLKKKNALFGKKYQEYTVQSATLKGACFFLSSGHGGPDPGAMGKVDGKTLCEDEYAYDITLRLARRLMEEGATVYMIIQDAKDGIRDDRYLSASKRETCMGATIPLGQVARLKQRADKINSLNKTAKEKYKRSLFVHLDSRSQKHQLDVFFYHAENSVAGKKLANTMRSTFNEQYKKHQPDRGFTGTVGSRGLYMLEKTAPVALFAELANMQNTFDQRRFLDPDNRQALANWICRGFIKDYENWKAGK